MSKVIPRVRFEGFTGEWEQLKLGEVVDIKDSARISNTLWEPKGIPYLRSSDLVNDGALGELFISDETYQLYKARTGAPEKDDVLFTSGGKVGITYHKIDDDPVYVQGGSILYAETSKSSKLNGMYLKAYFDSPAMAKYIEVASTGVTLKHFTLKPANATPIILSSLKEQQKIGTLFKRMEDTIALQRKMVKQQMEYKKAMLQKMFPKKCERAPKFRFEDFSGDWEDLKIKDIGTVVMCKRIFKDQTSSAGEIPFYKIGTFGAVADSYIPRELFKEYKLKYPYPEKGDILISASGTIGRMVVYSGKDEYFQDSNIIWVKRNKEKIENTFLKQFYNVVDWGSFEGSTIKRLYNSNILSTDISLPELEEQQKIGSFFKELDDTIELNQKKLEDYQQLKKALLQRMFV